MKKNDPKRVNVKETNKKDESRIYWQDRMKEKRRMRNMLTIMNESARWNAKKWKKEDKNKNWKRKNKKARTSRRAKEENNTV